MKRITFMYRQFLREPLWFKIVTPTMLLLSILFGSSLFSYDPSYQSFSKLAAAVFFAVFAVKMRRSRNISLVFLILTAVCLYLAWDAVA